MYFIGSLMKKGVGARLVFILPLGVRMRYMVRLHFLSSNNVAEYEALINGLRIAIELGIRWLDVWGDSQLVIDQLMKESSCHNAKMAMYCGEVHQLEDKFDGIELNHIPRWLNEAADALPKMVSGQGHVPIGIFVSDQYNPSVHYVELERTGDRPPTSGSRADQPLAPPDLKVMELDTDPVVEPNPLAH